MAWRYRVSIDAPACDPTDFMSGVQLDLPAEMPSRVEDDLLSMRQRAGDLREGRFTFLNITCDLGNPVDWLAADTTRLWRYNLHYFDYILDTAMVGRWARDEQAVYCTRSLIEGWIEANPAGQGIGWHAYPLARRVVNWIQAINLVEGQEPFQDEKFRGVLSRSLYQQLRFLENHLEFDSLGNHLLADGKALIMGGLFFEGRDAERWLKRGQRILWDGLREQILPDGGHYERSPMYQTIVLQDYLEVVLALREKGREAPAWVGEHLVLMADFLAGLCHPDGQIALFGDSAFGIARYPADVLAAASLLLDVQGRWSQAWGGIYTAMLTGKWELPDHPIPGETPVRLVYPDSGYLILPGGDDGDRLILDNLPIGPDHIPAHGHCSIFSYELSAGGQRFIVDSGVEEYQPGPWRDFWRSTRAHNTVAVDRMEQSEVWAAFRLARRAQVVESIYKEQDGSCLFVGTHDGFARSGEKIYHRRYLAALCGNKGGWVVLDQITGRGDHLVESFIHLSPEIDCIYNDNKIDAAGETAELCLIPTGSSGAPLLVEEICGEEEPIQGWYASRFGCREPNPVFVLSWRGVLPVVVGYLIAPADWGVKSWSWNLEDSEKGKRELDFLIRTATEEIPVKFDNF